MSTKELKQKVKALQFKRGSKYEFIQKLILSGFFDLPQTTDAIITEVRDIFGKRLKTNEVNVYMRKFMPDLIRAFRPSGHQGNFWVLASTTKEEALQTLNKNKKILIIEEQLFSEVLIKKLKKDFNIEISDLRHNFGLSGNCTAFLLRKILEKLIYITFSRSGIGMKLENKTEPGRLVGLEAMISLCVSEKVKGIPFLMSKTAQEIRGIKFLGDVSAHDPLTNVDIKTIIPQMPYIITAYEELAKKL